MYLPTEVNASLRRCIWRSRGLIAKFMHIAKQAEQQQILMAPILVSEDCFILHPFMPTRQPTIF